MATFLTPLILATQGFVQAYGLPGIFIISVFESFIFPVPTAFFVTPSTMLGLDPFITAVVATMGSIIGGIVGYAFGLYLGRPVATRLFKKSQIEKVEKWYGKRGEWVVLIAAAGPIPYKLVTWFSGIFELSFKKFMIFSVIGRTFQFFVAAYVGDLLGPSIIGLFL